MKGIFRTALFAALLAVVLSGLGQANAAELVDITAALDAAEEPSQIARLAGMLTVMAEVRDEPAKDEMAVDAPDLAAEEAAAAAVEAAAAAEAQRADTLTQLARAYYYLGETEKVEQRRTGYLDKAVECSDKVLKSRPGDPYATYWRSMAYLQKADIEGGISALGMVKRALKGFESVEAAEPQYDGAGAFRSHGRVLMEAPAWAFIGDKKRGVELLESARRVSPETLLNRLYLAEAYAVTDRPDDARAELEYIIASQESGFRPKEDADIRRDAAKLLAGLED